MMIHLISKLNSLSEWKLKIMPYIIITITIKDYFTVIRMIITSTKVNKWGLSSGLIGNVSARCSWSICNAIHNVSNCISFVCPRHFNWRSIVKSNNCIWIVFLKLHELTRFGNFAWGYDYDQILHFQMNPANRHKEQRQSLILPSSTALRRRCVFFRADSRAPETLKEQKVAFICSFFNGRI